jgi:HD-GYP domain-containing protein (c-di-GMP phosphodiesterase class II)
MENLVLQHDVITLSSEVLLPGGTRLDHRTRMELSRRQNIRVCRSHPFALLTDLGRDLREVLDKPPYSKIFVDPGETGEILSLMGQVELSEPVIEVLEYFREQDFHTYRHSLMVFALSTLLARHLYPDDRRSLLGALAGPSHDLGKICVPAKILQKTTPLTHGEVSILKHHAVAGYVLLAYHTGDVGHLSARVALDHHERRDGSGYPRGIATFDDMAEIVILSDIYDALISPRPYRPVSFDNRSALEELTRMAVKGQIGWLPLKALIAFNRGSRPQIDQCQISMEERGRAPAQNVYGLRVDDDDETG